MMTLDHLITAVLSWLLAGSLVWFALWCSGLINEVQARRQSSTSAMVVASVAVIVWWPVVVFTWCRALLMGGRR
ncbi:hypothetical protein [Bradyrhizobium sp. ORS 86]|uniref:hypothetical protein n=1 Tax=Bradyrhizobium sp. ORS 86 TaxID=1685970 RepID=UPI00388F81BA